MSRRFGQFLGVWNVKVEVELLGILLDVVITQDLTSLYWLAPKLCHVIAYLFRRLTQVKRGTPTYHFQLTV